MQAELNLKKKVNGPKIPKKLKKVEKSLKGWKKLKKLKKVEKSFQKLEKVEKISNLLRAFAKSAKIRKKKCQKIGFKKIILKSPYDLCLRGDSKICKKWKNGWSQNWTILAKMGGLKFLKRGFWQKWGGPTIFKNG